MRTLGTSFLKVGLAVGAVAFGVASPASAQRVNPALGDGSVRFVRDSVSPVLMVVANDDYSEPDYRAVRDALGEAGVPLEIAAPTADRPALGHEYGHALGIHHTTDAADASDFSALVICGGPGAVSLQDGFPGTYLDPRYDIGREARASVSRLIGAFLAQGKPVAAVNHGVTVLAWARVASTSTSGSGGSGSGSGGGGGSSGDVNGDGASDELVTGAGPGAGPHVRISPGGGPHVKAFAGAVLLTPPFVRDGFLCLESERAVRWHLEQNGFVVVEPAPSAAADGDDRDVLYDPEGDLLPPAKPARDVVVDDVVVDGQIITGSSVATGKTMAAAVLAGMR